MVFEKIKLSGGGGGGSHRTIEHEIFFSNIRVNFWSDTIEHENSFQISG